MGGLQFAFAIMGSFVSPYQKYKLQMQPWESYLSFLAGPICGFFVQPIVGALSDRCSLLFGRRRPYIVAGAITTALSLAFLCFSWVPGQIFTPHNPARVAVIVALIGLILLNTTINMMLAPVRSIIQDIVPQQALDKGNAYSALMLGAAFFLCNIMFFILLAVFGIRPADASFVTLLEAMGAFGAVVIVLLTIPTLIIGRESPLKQVEQVAAAKLGDDAKEPEAKRFFLIDMAITLIHMPARLKTVCLVFFLSWAGYFPVQMFTSSLFNLTEACLAIAISNLVGSLWTFPLAWLCSRFGEKWPYFCTQTLAAISTVGMVFVGPLNGAFPHSNFVTVPALIILMSFIGINTTTTNSAPFSMIGKEQSDNAGAYVGVMNAFCVLAQATVLLLSSIVSFPFGIIPFLKHSAFFTEVHNLVPLILSAMFTIAAAVCCLFLRTRSVKELMAEAQGYQDLEADETTGLLDDDM
ncbi:MFS transporter [Carpediemonas membranifera]|uniref:MFS transporter n=1 Tax=Carpediemonas membranifera TaxID=201153 RepID=A0A8J6B0D9_9EUKA|nr:MFS transporter [Carpediemonas membranifera]|eukprot:KAG9390302.1 MFS transporter [Carpediemonas membranifera]